MQDYPQQRIDKKAVSYWRWTGIISAIFYAIFPAGYYFAASFFHLPIWIGVVLTLGAILLAIYSTIIAPNLRWKTWRYDVSAQEIDLLYGVFIKTHTIIPMVRVQHVDTEQGPLLRKFGLSSVTIATAAGEHEIPALSDETATQLRQKIAELARVVDEDV